MLLKLVRWHNYPKSNLSYTTMRWKANQQARRQKTQKKASKKSRLQFENVRDKEVDFWRHILWSDKTKVELWGHDDRCYIGGRFSQHHPIMWSIGLAGSYWAEPLQQVSQELLWERVWSTSDSSKIQVIDVFFFYYCVFIGQPDHRFPTFSLPFSKMKLDRQTPSLLQPFKGIH